MKDLEEIPILSIGILLGDSSLASKPWDSAITKVSREIMGLREGINSPLRLNVIYQVDGKLVPLEFSGVRTGRFSKKNSLLVVQVAVPVNQVNDERKEVLGLLEQAINEAEQFAIKRKISTNLHAIRGVLSNLLELPSG